MMCVAIATYAKAKTLEHPSCFSHSLKLEVTRKIYCREVISYVVSPSWESDLHVLELACPLHGL